MPLHSALQQFIFDHSSRFLKGPVLVACSGGPDSVALVRVLSQLGVPIHVGHVNHALRGKESLKDAQFVRKLAKQLAVPYHEIKAPINGKHGNLEEKARVKRYDALFKMKKKYRCSWILTAHTLDDQVETIFMNLLRGSGVTGLSGMDGENVVGRPFLTVSKADILTYLKKEKFSFRMDSSNLSDRFTRNWLRKKIMPLLESRFPGFKSRIGQASVILRDEEVHWRKWTAQMKTSLLRRKSTGHLLDFIGLLRYSAGEQRRFLRHILGGDLLSFDGVERLRRWLNSAPTSGRIWQGKDGWVVERLSKSQGAPSARHFWVGKKGIN